MKIQAMLLSEQSRTFELDCRLGLALAQLADADADGVTPIICPAPRWSAYVHKLRKIGFPIDKVMEEHSGPYPGQHARHRLACDVQIKMMSQEVQT